MISQISNGHRVLECRPCGTSRSNCRVRGVIGAGLTDDPVTWEAAHVRAERALQPTVCVQCGGSGQIRKGTALCPECLANRLQRPP